MSGEVKTQGTKLQLAGTASPVTYTDTANVVSISGLGGQKGDIDITNFDSTAKEFLTGLEDPGQVQVEINYAPADATQDTMWSLKNSGALRTWRITMPGASPAPYFSFAATVQQFQVNFQTDDVVRATVTLRVSGAITKSAP
jgi:hypothetical protein